MGWVPTCDPEMWGRDFSNYVSMAGGNRERSPTRSFSNQVYPVTFWRDRPAPTALANCIRHDENTTGNYQTVLYFNESQGKGAIQLEPESRGIVSNQPPSGGLLPLFHESPRRTDTTFVLGKTGP